MIRPAISFVLAIVSIIGPRISADASGQTPASPSISRPFAALRAQVRQLVDVKEVRELRIRWTVVSRVSRTDAAEATHSFTVLEQTVTAGRLRRERRPELSPDRLVVIVEDVLGHELDWRIVANPRIVRAEWPRPDGQLTGRAVERDDVELALTIPGLPNAEAMSIYQPRWTGSDYVLDRLSRIVLQVKP